MDNFTEKFKITADQYVKLVYELSATFPREEIFGVTSQLRRSSLSVLLNFIEGYARRRGPKCKTFLNFLYISYGSLKESKYLLYLSMHLGYLKQTDYNKLITQAEELGAMLYKTIDLNK